MDANGRVSAVNAVWRVVAAGDDFFAQTFQRGISYLGLCDSTRGLNARAAGTIANGLRSVLDGSHSSFETQYVWYFGQECRGFKCLISSLGADSSAASRGAMVMHVEIATPIVDRPDLVGDGDGDGDEDGDGAGLAASVERLGPPDVLRDIGMVADIVPALVFHVDADLILRAANRHFESWFGVAAADVIGMNVADVTGQMLFRRIQSHVYTALSGRRVSFEDVFEDQPGSRRWFSATFIPDVTKEGRVRGFSGLAFDITRHKDLEKSLDDAKLASDHAMRVQTELLGHVGGELRAPLTAIVGFSETLASELFGPLGEQYREYAKDIRDTACGLSDMVGDLVDLAKVQSGQLQLDEERVNLGVLLKSAIGWAQQESRESGVKMVAKLPRHVPGLFADERLLRRIVVNLIASAVRLASDGATVTLSTRSETDGSLALLVTNEEAVIRQADLDRMAEPFARLEAPRSVSTMAGGLTLPLTRHFIELHGGALSLLEGGQHGGKGVTLAVRFPRARVVG
ncbi:MAG: PAS domain-containing sensor histidine kinase [Alphaproteobacteria bacterium]|nr:PAS domain-containing sensor histidine kinase [Alphaproteobacteria bacterium]